MVSSLGKAGMDGWVWPEARVPLSGEAADVLSLLFSPGGMECTLYKHSPCPAKDGRGRCRLDCEPPQLRHSASPTGGGRPHAYPLGTATKRIAGINTWRTVRTSRSARLASRVGPPEVSTAKPKKVTCNIRRQTTNIGLNLLLVPTVPPTCSVSASRKEGLSDSIGGLLSTTLSVQEARRN